MNIPPNSTIDEEEFFKIIFDLLNREIKRISISADLHDIDRLDWSSAIGASKRRKKLLATWKILENISELPSGED